VSNRITSMADFLALLKGVKAGKDGEYKALCPGHNDHGPSLSAKEINGKILVKCFAGCKLVDILKPLHLEPKDLFLNGRNPKARSQKKLVATYSYEIEKGKEAFQIRRYDLSNGEKTFECGTKRVINISPAYSERVSMFREWVNIRASVYSTICPS